MKTWTENGKAVVKVNEEEYEVEVTGTFSRYKDGQDADGNRGWMVTDMDDLKIESIVPEPDTTQREAIENLVYSLSADDFSWKERDEREEA